MLYFHFGVFCCNGRLGGCLERHCVALTFGGLAATRAINWRKKQREPYQIFIDL